MVVNKPKESDYVKRLVKYNAINDDIRSKASATLNHKDSLSRLSDVIDLMKSKKNLRSIEALPIAIAEVKEPAPKTYTSNKVSV